MATEKEKRERRELEDKATANASANNYGYGNMLNFLNPFAQSAPMQTSPEVLEQMRHQQSLGPGRSISATGQIINNNQNMPGMFFGAGPRFSQSPQMAQQDQMQNAISSVYNLQTGGMAGTPGVFDNTPVTEPGFMDKLGSLSGDEIMGGLQGVKGLLDAVYPEQAPLIPQRIPSASAGLSLSTNPYEDLYKRYGLLGR